MKKIFAFLIALTPGSVFFMYGDIKKSIIYIATLIIAAYFYRLSGILGPNIFFAAIIVLTICYIGLCASQIRRLEKTIAMSQLIKGLIFCLFAVFLIKGIFKYLSPGNTFTTSTNKSMMPLISDHEYVYVSNLSNDFSFGDIVLYRFQNNPFLGIICGVGGDTISVQDLTIYRNQKGTDCGIRDFNRLQSASMNELKIEEGSYFIAKPNGLDSSFLNKAFSKADIEGKVLFKIRDMPFPAPVELLLILAN